MVSINTNICGIKLKNPTILASGILGVTASSLKRVADSGAGAVTIKSIGPEKRLGHKNPVVVEVPYGLLNSVGLPTPGPEEAVEELKRAMSMMDIPIIASFYGRTMSEFKEMAKKISAVNPDFLELNISCPNVEDACGKPFSTDPDTAANVTEIVKNVTEIPLIVKLSPNVSDIKSIAKSVENAGADAISAINTMPSMKIDIETGKPILSNKTGGLSGPAIKPIAVRCVYEITSVVEIPVIGIGGITTAEDAIEMMMAGASAVGIGTAIMYKDLKVFKEITNGIKNFMKSRRYKRLDEIIRIAHRE